LLGRGKKWAYALSQLDNDAVPDLVFLSEERSDILIERTTRVRFTKNRIIS
jgi:hypothetical protein